MQLKDNESLSGTISWEDDLEMVSYRQSKDFGRTVLFSDAKVFRGQAKHARDSYR